MKRRKGDAPCHVGKISSDVWRYKIVPYLNVADTLSFMEVCKLFYKCTDKFRCNWDVYQKATNILILLQNLTSNERFDLLRYLRPNGLRNYELGVCAMSALRKNVNYFVKFIDEFISFDTIIPREVMFKLAALEDLSPVKLIVKKYESNREDRMEFLSNLLTRSAEHGNEILFHFILGIISEDFLPSWSHLSYRAAAGGNFSLLRFCLHRTGYIPRLIQYNAARYGHLSLVQYFAEPADMADPDLHTAAVFGNNVDLLKYLEEFGATWTMDHFVKACHGKALETAKYIYGKLSQDQRVDVLARLKFPDGRPFYFTPAIDEFIAEQIALLFSSQT